MDVNSPAFLENPYQFYDQRRLDGVLFKRDDVSWAVTGYDVMSKILAHPAAGRGNIGQAPRRFGERQDLDQVKPDNLALQLLDRWMLFQNPPKHTQSRGRVSDVFTVKLINQLESMMRATMRALIADIKVNHQNGHFDLVSTIAYPYPIKVICNMLGVPESDHGKFSAWTKGFSLAVQTDFLTASSSVKQQLNESAQAVSDYFEQLIPRKKAEQADDLITRLIMASGDDLEHEELVANCVFLLFAGQDTTTSLIANALNALLHNPKQLTLLRENPALSKNAVEECLRYDPSIQMVGRLAIDDIVIDKVTIKQGEHLFVFLGAAGRDPAANVDPHRLDISRQKIKHLAFARGVHHCLGASLARLEIRVMLEELLAAFPELAMAGKGVRRPTWLMRGFDSLPVAFSR